MGTEHLHPVYSRNSTVHIVTPQQGMEKHATFAAAMAQSGFIQHLLGHWEASKDTEGNPIPKVQFAVAIKPNIMTASASLPYSQIELRIMAHISQDEGLLKAFASGEDIHKATAAEIFGIALEQVDSEQRRYAKVINFGLIYGMLNLVWLLSLASHVVPPVLIWSATFRDILGWKNTCN